MARRIYDDITMEDLGEAPKLETLAKAQRKIKYHIKMKVEEDFYRELAENGGDFYFLFYKLNHSDIEKQHIIRYLYLCTYMDWDNKLIYNNGVDEPRYMIETDLYEVLNLAKPIAKKTRIAIIENDLMSVNELGQLVINKEFCLKGKVDKEHKKAMKIRIFGRAVRELYEKSLPREHKKLNLLVTLLPFINFSHNILCKNPDCKHKYEIDPMDLQDVAEIIGYNVKNLYRLRKDLLALRVGGELVIMLCITDLAEFIKINPKVYYRATPSDLNTLKELEGDFRIVRR